MTARAFFNRMSRIIEEDVGSSIGKDDYPQADHPSDILCITKESTGESLIGRAMLRISGVREGKACLLAYSPTD